MIKIINLNMNPSLKFILILSHYWNDHWWVLTSLTKMTKKKYKDIRRTILKKKN